MSITTKSLWESVVLDDRPSGYWGLDTADPLVDDSGNGGTLTAIAAPANNAGLLAFGDTGAAGARDFNGTTQAYTAADSAFLDLADEFTLGLVFNPDVVTGTATLISKGTNGYQLRRNGTALELHKEGVGLIVASSGLVLAAGFGYHVMVAKRGATSCKMYVNNVDVTGTVTDRTCENTATALNIGRKSDATEYFDGKIDEVQVYPYAFTASMVATHYAVLSAGTFGQQILGTPAASTWPRIKVEIAFSSNAQDTYQRWEDVTADCRQLNTNRGRNFALDRSETGRCSFSLLNRSRQYDPTFATGPYYPNIVLTKAVRVRAQINTSQTYPRFRGSTDAWLLQYGASGKDPTVTVQASGTFKALSLDKYLVPTPRDAELSGTRLAAVAVTSGVRYTGDAGQSVVSGIDLEQANRLEHSLAVAETDGGVLFESGDGTITFQDRHYRIKNESSVRQVYGDGGGTQIPILSPDPQLDEDRLFTAASITPTSGVAQTAEDTAATARHFKRTKELSTLHDDAYDAKSMAEMYAYRYSTTRTRIPTVAPVPALYSTPATAWATVLGHEISHRISTSIRPMGDSSAVVREHFIEGMNEQWLPSGVSVAFSVSPAELDSEYWILGTGELGDASGLLTTILGW